MKTFAKLLTLTLLLAAISVVISLVGIKHLVADDMQTSTPQLSLKGNSKQLALIFAHDDDYVGCAGTIAALRAQGYEFSYLCLTSHNHDGQSATRMQEMKLAAEVLGLKSLENLSMDLHDGTITYMPIPYTEMRLRYKTDSIRMVIEKFLTRVQPAAIFTLDHEIGGYGHPDHVYVSMMVQEVCRKLNLVEKTKVELLLECVYADPLEHYVSDELPVYQEAKQVYGVEGMPTPNLAFDISAHSATKLEALSKHKSQVSSLRLFCPYYEVLPPDLYGWVFPKEYFRSIKL